MISGDLEAPSTTASGGNGMYLYGATGAFPALSAYGSNYWVDVLFDAASGQIANATAAVGTAAPYMIYSSNQRAQSVSPSLVLPDAYSNTVPASFSDSSSTNVAKLARASARSTK